MVEVEALTFIIKRFRQKPQIQYPGWGEDPSPSPRLKMGLVWGAKSFSCQAHQTEVERIRSGSELYFPRRMGVAWLNKNEFQHNPAEALAEK